MTHQREHPNETELMRFLERHDQTADYVHQTAIWIQREYPGSAARLLPLLRELYARKIRAGGFRR